MDEIRIKLPSDSDASRRLQIDLQDTVLKCKHIIQEMHNVPYEVQRIFFDGRILDDEKSLADCGVQNGDEVEIWEPGDIEIMLLSKRSFNVWIEPSFTINTLRRIIDEEKGYHWNDVRLIHKGRDVYDYQRQMAGWGIGKGARVFMVYRCRYKHGKCECNTCN